MVKTTRRGWLALMLSLAGVTRVSAQTSASPARIVSTSPTITETLFALGLGERVVGVSTFCRYPAQVASITKVGTFLKPNVETIARLRPDLVFVHSKMTAASSQLTALGIRTSAIDRGSLASVFSTIKQIGDAAGASDRATTLIAQINRDLDAVRAASAKSPKQKVLMIVGRRTGMLTDLIAVGPGTYLSEIAELAGAENVMNGVALEYPRISLETVIHLAPDVIIDVGEMGEAPATWEKRRAVSERLWSQQTLVKAVKAKRVFVINDEAFVTPGPRVVTAARTVASMLRPSTSHD
jgi:iron complex transport system substrate-binding protein